MDEEYSFFRILGIEGLKNGELRKLANEIGIAVSELRYYNKTNTVPVGKNLDIICDFFEISPYNLMLRMGKVDLRLLEMIQKNADSIYSIIGSQIEDLEKGEMPLIVDKTLYGTLYQGDSISLMSGMESESIDLIFADPPFNLNKTYPSKIDDNLKTTEYLQWTERWLIECVRLLKDGGSLFVWNLPKWNIHAAKYLSNFLNFRDWIAVDIKYSLPIANRLYPSHYSLLYFCKGERPKTFHPDRLPMPVCPKCSDDLKDYGGYKHKMNPKGVSLPDVWTDLSPVRHSKYKKRQDANELPLKLLDRIVEISTDVGDMVFDPFGGAGTTYVAAEIKKRKWVGCEIGPVDDIIDRFKNIDEEKKYLEKFRKDYNVLFTEKTLKIRIDKELWTCESVRKEKEVGKRKKRVKQEALFES